MSLFLADQTSIAVSAAIHPPLPPTNLYFMAISRINEVKQGPFHEHSSQLHSIAVGVASWNKVNSGLFKMYEVRDHRSLQLKTISKQRALG
jgi:serine/threonine-protein phosphatase 2A activator